MFSKIEVNGDGTCELYRLLRSAQPSDAEKSDVTWNFEKFVVDRAGNVVHRFSPMTKPEELESVVSGLLEEQPGA